MKGGRAFAPLAIRWKTKGGAMLPFDRNSLPVRGQRVQTGGGHGGPPYGLPQGLVNMAREVEFGIKSLYETAVGGQQPVNPDPSEQPLGNSHKQMQYLPLAINPKELIKDAQAEVGRL